MWVVVLQVEEKAETRALARDHSRGLPVSWAAQRVSTAPGVHLGTPQIRCTGQVLLRASSRNMRPPLNLRRRRSGQRGGPSPWGCFSCI